jgi:magnesium transporter
MPDDLHESLTDLLAQEGIDRDRLREIVAFIDPVDLAEFLEDLNLDDRVRLFDVLDADRAARVMEALPHDLRVALVDHLGEERMSAVVQKMSADAVADIIDHLPAHRETAILERVEREHRQEIEALRKYSPTTAGGLMTTDYVAVREDFTAAQTLKAIQGAVNEDTIDYAYVTDADDRLVGVCSTRAILRAAPETSVRDFMRRDLQFVGATVDQEEVAQIVRKYDLRAIPVVDGTLKLIGIVTQARILDVIHQEAGEDIAKMAGASRIHPLHASIGQRLRSRVPSLSVALGLEMVIALEMKAYGGTLEHLALAYFVPIIMAMGGSVGVQTSTLVVRGLATGELTVARGLRVALVELFVGLATGLVAGVVTGTLAFVMEVRGPAPMMLALIVFVSMAISLTVAAVVGTLTPLAIQRMRGDPAVASGPFVTCLNDLVNVTLYLTIATLLLTRSA